MSVVDEPWPEMNLWRQARKGQGKSGGEATRRACAGVQEVVAWVGHGMVES